MAADGEVKRRFVLYRHCDVTGVSGTGVVAEGVVYSDDCVSLRWTSRRPCTTVWNSVEDILAVHGHAGRTDVRWIDASHEQLQLPRNPSAEPTSNGHVGESEVIHRHTKS